MNTEHFVLSEAPNTAISLNNETLYDDKSNSNLHALDEVKNDEMMELPDAGQTGDEDHPTTTAMTKIIQFSKWVELPDFVPPREKRMFLELFSGPRHPLSSHIRSLGVTVLEPFDILLDPKLNILDDQCCFSILRLVASREVGTVVAAPPCTEYSLLKLKQPGPLPCRLPDQLDIPLYNTEDCHRRFYESKEILYRTSVVLHVQHIHGGYSGLEQPLHAMSWE